MFRSRWGLSSPALVDLLVLFTAFSVFSAPCYIGVFTQALLLSHALLHLLPRMADIRGQEILPVPPHQVIFLCLWPHYLSESCFSQTDPSHTPLEPCMVKDSAITYLDASLSFGFLHAVHVSMNSGIMSLSSLQLLIWVSHLSPTSTVHDIYIFHLSYVMEYWNISPRLLILRWLFSAFFFFLRILIESEIPNLRQRKI